MPRHRHGGVSTCLEQARLAYERVEWDDAIRGFHEVDREEGLAAADLVRWAHAAQCAGRNSEAMEPLERAVAAHAATGGRRAAGSGAALMLAQIQFERRGGGVAPAGTTVRRGSWRARRRQGNTACWSGSPAGFTGRQWRSGGGGPPRLGGMIRLGQRLADHDLEALGLLYWGLALIALGDVESGVTLQGGSQGAAALAGEVSQWVGGTVYCGIIWGCRNRLDWQRAAQWTAQFTRWCERSRLGGYPGLCRLHRAEVLSVCGEVTAAEQEIREACEQLAASAPWAEGDGYRVLGELRLACGDLTAAETAFRRAYELGWDSQPGYALLHLARGRADLAVRGLERALSDRRWTNSQLAASSSRGMAIAATAASQKTGHARRWGSWKPSRTSALPRRSRPPLPVPGRKWRSPGSAARRPLPRCGRASISGRRSAPR